MEPNTMNDDLTKEEKLFIAEIMGDPKLKRMIDELVDDEDE